MLKAKKIRRINTKVSESDYQALQRIVRAYGFNSLYQLLQALLLCFLRHVDSVRDSEYETGIAVEIDEMFDDLAQTESQSKTTRSYTTYQHRK